MTKKKFKTKSKSKLVYADISQRILANVIDFVLLLTIGFVTNAVLSNNFSMNFSFEFTRNLLIAIQVIPTLQPLLIILTFLLSLSFLSLYFLIMWVCAGGQTLGKKIVGIKIISTSKKDISYLKAIIRFFLSILSLSLFGLGFIQAIFDKKKQAWHDKLSETIVVKE